MHQEDDIQKKRKEVLKFLFKDPKLRAAAKKVRKKTTAMPIQKRGLRRKNVARRGAATKKVVLDLKEDNFDQMIDQIESTGKPPKQARKVIMDSDNLDQMVQKIENEGKVLPDAKKVLIDNNSPYALDRAIDMIEQGKNIPPHVKGSVVSVKTQQPSKKQVPPNTRILKADTGDELDNIVKDVEEERRRIYGTRKILINSHDGQSLDSVIRSIENNTDNEDILVDQEDSVLYMQAVEEIEVAGRAPENVRQAIINADNPSAFDEAIYDLEKNYIENEEDAEDIDWMIKTISQANIPSVVFDDIVENIKSNKTVIPKMGNIPDDVMTYAKEMGVNPKNFYEAMKSENFNSLNDFLDVCKNMGYSDNISTFILSFINSYVDKKNEEALLGLIGVSALTGGQSTGSEYSKLLEKLFRPEIGGFFLNETKNLNYNCFNIGNVVQEKLLQLEEEERVTFLEKLISLLSKKDVLIEQAKTLIQKILKQSAFIKILPNIDGIIEKLEQYTADLAIYKLGLLESNELPNNISDLLPENIYEFLDFIIGIPKDLVQKNSKILYMLKALADDNPMLFHRT